MSEPGFVTYLRRRRLDTFLSAGRLESHLASEPRHSDSRACLIAELDQLDAEVNATSQLLECINSERK